MNVSRETIKENTMSRKYVKTYDARYEILVTKEMKKLIKENRDMKFAEVCRAAIQKHLDSNGKYGLK